MKNIILLILLLTYAGSCREKTTDPVPTIDVGSPDLKYDQTRQLKVMQGSQILDFKSYIWKIDDESIGTVRADGLFTARKVGESIISVSEQNGKLLSQTKIVVTPYSTLCTEPITERGISSAAILSRERRSLNSKLHTRLDFFGENEKVKKVIYELNSQGNLEFSVLVLVNTKAVYEEAELFLTERYPTHITEEGMNYYLNDKRDQAIYVGKTNENEFKISYTPQISGGLRKVQH
ncbi:hypothetical protein DYBT9623_05355 [Dyadobacter sp. CECT 9623]|uniref:BIG2 domain-containing protein n=1 Tax=Dyadobacter linearis TaxID=2823330 RepID=A0ABM8UYH8_9BACT|nr:hypothetical protein [Dyadobacter sp. CECT 9623]CAG5074668.1 hypothetical protein DYBT9623_05355 [Dyadobacter sp. CECT 9623]